MLGKAVFWVVLAGFVLMVPSNARAELFMSVSGKVVAEDDGAPLGGVRLLLMSQEKGRIAETRSNLNGVFELENVPKGAHSILPIPEDPFLISPDMPIPVTVLDGKNVVGGTVKLHRGGAIRGRVLAGNGVPVPQATITTSAGPMTSTDDAGYFLLGGIAPGNVKIGVMPPGVGIRAMEAVARIGQLTDLGTISFSVGPDSAMSGTVTDTDGRPVSGAILIAHGTGKSVGYGISRDDGYFYITGMPADSYKLSVVANGYQAVSLSEVAVPSTGVAVVLSALPEVSFNAFRYRIGPEEMYSQVVPASFEIGDYDGDGRCPNGLWSGVSADFTALLVPLGVFKSGGGSASVGVNACWNSLARLDFLSLCGYSGVNNTILSYGLGVTGTYCYNACLRSDLLDWSHGPLFSSAVNTPVPQPIAPLFGFGTDFGTATCNWISVGFGGSLPSRTLAFPKDAPFSGIFVGYRACHTRQFNIWEFLSKVM